MVLTHNHSIGTIWIFCPLTYNSEVTKLTWPLVTDIKNPRYTSCRHHDCMKRRRFETNRISSVTTAQPQSETRFLLWPDLVTWPLVTWGWNFYTRCQIQLWAGTEKMAALRAAVFPLSAKNRRGGHFLSPPPPVKGATFFTQSGFEKSKSTSQLPWRTVSRCSGPVAHNRLPKVRSQWLRYRVNIFDAIKYVYPIP